MTVAAVATTHTRKLMKLGLSLFRRGFNASKCKTAAKMAVARIKLLRNKREVVVKQMRRDVALLLQSGQDATARIRVEHVIREQNVLAANEFLELFCDLVVARLSIIAKQRECPADLKEGISSLIFAALRCSEIPELVALRDIFEKKYGRDFVSAAADLRPNCGVNRMLIDKLSVRTPSGEVKLKIMKEIAKEYQIDWDTTETEKELLKPAEKLIEGPKAFVSAASLPVKPVPIQPPVEVNTPTTRRMSGGERGNMHFVDSASAAEAAAKCADDAIAAAQAAAYWANKDVNQTSPHAPPCFSDKFSTSNVNFGYEDHSSGSRTGPFMPDGPPVDFQTKDHQSKAPERTYELQSFDRSHYARNGETVDLGDGKFYRRHSDNVQSSHSDIKFDESDCDEEIEMETPPVGFCPQPERNPPPLPSSDAKNDPSIRVHPKLPDYDALAARFEALKHRKS
ncbi:hypothetical protein FEM48_Zijuj08G0080600 [Ziziphus jujuba var. spinosa]|uniref:IST1-like protein n=1 Tax=Ziziphus jujuba var. spinosa TaxID=714518 RepID=A0A978UXY0_ZIZJJ|nr:hypothetical protein FEM48_Zijuj08G0080600 [Ziziphus jujuba var. spinosa]